MPKISLSVWAGAFLPLVFAIGLRGDTLELKTGERIEGTFKEATAGGAVIGVAGQSITIPLDKVRAIYLGSAPATQRAAITGPTPLDELMVALKGLRSVTTSGISYRDYSQRVLDAKVKFDAYMSSKGTESAAIRDAVELAMQWYELSSHAWSDSFGNSFTFVNSVGTAVLTNNKLSSCPSVVQALSLAYKPKTPPTPAERIQHAGLAIAVQPSSLWPCASAQVDEAERLLAKQ